MLKQMKPKVFTPESFDAVANASSQQTGKTTVPKSIDPQNFPVFDVPVNKKVLVYVPNHTTVTENGTDLAMDKGAFHRVIAGGAFYTKRCYSGVVNEAEGYDGTCGLCETQQEVWDLYNKEYEQLCKQKGVDPTDKNDTLKTERTALLKKQAIQKAEVFRTFPIVVVDMIEEKLVPKLDGEGQVSAQTQWYVISEKSWQDKWVKSLSAIDTGEDGDGEPVTHPGGRWFILDFTYTSDSGKHDKMTSAQKLQVVHKSFKKYAKVAESFDKMTEEWTPLKATQTVIANFFLDVADVKDIVEEAMKPTREKLVMLNAMASGVAQNLGAGAGTGAVAGSPESVLGAFGATAVVAGTDAGAGVNPNAPVDGSNASLIAPQANLGN